MSKTIQVLRKQTTRKMALQKNAAGVQLLPLDSEYFQPVEVQIKGKRDRVADELLRTEQSYVRSLNVLVNHYKHPMIDAIIQKELPITEDQLKTLYGNLEGLINVNTTLLTDLVERMRNWNDTTRIGDVFGRLSPFLKLYSHYSLNYEKSIQELEEMKKKPAVKTWLEKKGEDALVAGLDFSAFLIMPIQRIPRYRLLLEELLSATPKEHPDWKDMNEALQKMKSVADDVNVAIVEQENREKMLKVAKKFIDYKEKEILAPGRRYIRDGELSKVCRRVRKVRHFFLFSDALIYSFPTEKNGKFKISNQFKLLYLSVKDVEDDPSRNLTNAFQITTDAKSFIVIAQSSDDKLNWIQCLSDSIAQYKSNVKTLGTQQEDPSNVFVAPVWVPDDEVKACRCCNTKFTIVNRRHHCRQCGQIVCGTCSDNNRILKVGQAKVRVCSQCIQRPVDWTPEQGTVNFDESSSDDDVEVLFVLKALYPYTPDANANQRSQKLPFTTGEEISILQTDDSGWWLAELNGQRGWVPCAYLEKPPTQN